jgi:hypothetical protein
MKGLIARIARVQMPLVAAQAGSCSPLRLRALMMCQKIVTWSLSDLLCLICLVIVLPICHARG